MCKIINLGHIYLTPPPLFPAFHNLYQHACDTSGPSINGEIDLMEKAMFSTKKDPQVVELEHFRPQFILALFKILSAVLSLLLVCERR